MGPAGSVLVPYFGELFLAKSRAELDQCWPQAAMHVRNLSLNQLADEDVGIRRDWQALNSKTPGSLDG